MKITKERTYPFPIESVWTALTDARAIRQWWVDTDFVAEPGREFYFQDTPQRGWDGRVTGRVIVAEPPRLVEFSWTGGGLDTRVRYELRPVPSGTRLLLTHDGFSGLGGLLLGTMLRFGWRSYVRTDLPAIVEHVDRRGIGEPFPTPPKAQRTGSRSRS